MLFIGTSFENKGNVKEEVETITIIKINETIIDIIVIY